MKTQMTMDEATRILKTATLPKFSGLEGTVDSGGDVNWRAYNSTASLEGEFTADHLEAIAVWMRENADPTRD